MRKFPYSNQKEFQIFKKYNTPAKIQDFINKIPINFELQGETYYSPLNVMKENKAHCAEGAMLALAMLWYHGIKSYLLDMKTTDDDEGHIITIFKQNGLWGALSKTNHFILRYRDPIYKSIRELVMSYFHEYFVENGKKTLRYYLPPLSLYDYVDEWLIADYNLEGIEDDLNAQKPIWLIDKKMAKNLRPTDKIQRKALDMTDWKR